MAGAKQFRGLAILGLAVMLPALGRLPAMAQSSFANPLDPPVIIHGGSLHAAVKGETYDPELKTLTVPVKDVSKVTLAGYKKPPKLGTEWTMQICNEDPCIHGMVMSAKAGSISISLINPKDLIAKGRKSIYGQTDYELIGTGGSDEYYPEYLSIKENGATTKYNCVTDPSGDWTSCRIQIGPRQK
jgi:hypothetical protein